jgi:hypothetical protein
MKTDKNLPWFRQYHGNRKSPLLNEIQKAFSKEAKERYLPGDCFPVPTSSARYYKIKKNSYYKIFFSEGYEPENSWFEGVVTDSNGLVADVFDGVFGANSWKSPFTEYGEHINVRKRGWKNIDLFPETVKLMNQYIEEWAKLEKSKK